EIADAQGEMATVPGEASEGDHALDGIATVHPGEAVRLAVALMERRFGPAHTIQVGHQALEAAVVGSHIEEMPVEAAVVVPFRGLAELAPHEEQLLPRIRPHERVEETEVGEALPVVAGHLGDERALAVDDLV